MVKGTVFDIQRFSVHDGPGIRTTVFLKGCPLACRWCHNPEGRAPQLQVRFLQTRCLGCKMCEACTKLPPDALAGKPVGEAERMAAEACPAGALIVSGKQYTPEQLMDVLLRDQDFYGKQGGVTFSGGEPMEQSVFLEEMLLLCRKYGIHAAIDTCGYASVEAYQKLLPLCKLVLFDIKGMDPEKHRMYTGVDNQLILENFRVIAASGVPVWIRIPLISVFSADEAELQKIAEFLLPYREAVQQVTLIPYHSFGNTKYPTLGLVPEVFDDIDDETVRHYETYFTKAGFAARR